jgi:hypothetical protein
MKEYPSEEERKKIIAKRKQLARGLINCLIATNERKRNVELNRLARRYGQAEVERQLRFLSDNLAVPRNSDEDEAIIYRKYVGYYRRFGGKRPLLSRPDYASLNGEFGPLLARQEVGQALTAAEQERLAHLTDLLLKEAPFWEDLVPEDPPPAIPKLDPPPLEPSDSHVPIQAGTSGRPSCPRDSFPLLRINGELECSAEYIDRCVGGHSVVDVVHHGPTTYYVFEDGHQVPLLCGCCGGPLSVTDLAKVRKQMQGRRLEAMSMAPQVTQDGRNTTSLSWNFPRRGSSQKGLLYRSHLK